MNAVIYCRVSSKEQVEGTSLESQQIACADYATSNHLTVVKIFVERGESAKFADRTQLLELLAFCAKREHRVERLLVWKVDRLARNVGDHFNIKASLLKHDIRVVSVTEPIDANPEGRLLETILAGFAQFDNDIRAARTLQGMRRKIQEGIFPWKPPFGYIGAKQPGNKKTEPDKPEQPAFGLMQQAWNEFATGAYTKAQIIRLVTGRGLRMRTGKPISKQTLDNIFRDHFYAGIIRDPWSGEEHTGQHLPMVSRETFGKVQNVISRTKRSVSHKSIRPEFPLRVFVRCSVCNHSLTGAFSRGRSASYAYYRCFNRACTSGNSYPAKVVHDEFTSFLASTTPRDAVLARLKEYVSEGMLDSTSTRRELMQKRASDISRVRQHQDQLIRMKMEQMITDEEYKMQRSHLLERLADLETTQFDVRNDDILDTIDSICVPLKDLTGTWAAISTEFKRRFQHLAIPAGYVIGRIGTAQRGHLFTLLGASDLRKSTLVPLTGTSLNQLAEEITTFARIIKESSQEV